MNSQEEEEKRKREQEKRQLQTIHFLATWLPWVSVVVVLISTASMILWAFFFGHR